MLRYFELYCYRYDQLPSCTAVQFLLSKDINKAAFTGKLSLLAVMTERCIALYFFFMCAIILSHAQIHSKLKPVLWTTFIKWPPVYKDDFLRSALFSLLANTVYMILLLPRRPLKHRLNCNMGSETFAVWPKRIPRIVATLTIRLATQ